MTSPLLADRKPQFDTVEVLRLLVTDLQSLADRLELKATHPEIGQTLAAALARVSGPRATVMLLGEQAALKRRFLERLLGPNLPPLPETGCVRLEYGPELLSEPAQGIAHTTADAIPSGESGHALRTIRLPNPALQAGLVLIDTPALAAVAIDTRALDSTSMDHGEALLLECAEAADAWICVLGAEHALSERGKALLRRLPERGARLEMVVEDAGALTSEESAAARERLMATLREECGIEAPRLTLISSNITSDATESDEGDIWQGRFATFHSVMMLRGREHWLKGTRDMTDRALAEVERAIDAELKEATPGLRYSRLRLGRKDLEGLRTRFEELGRWMGGRSAEPKAAETTTSGQSRLDWSGGVGAERPDGLSPLALLEEAIAAAMQPENAAADMATSPAQREIPSELPPDLLGLVTQAETLEPSTMPATAIESRPASAEEPAYSAADLRNTDLRSASVHAPEPAPLRLGGMADTREKHGVSVNFSRGASRLMGTRSRDSRANGGMAMLRVALVILAIVFVCLVVWALSPRGFFFGSEPASEWEYQPPAGQAAPPAPVLAGDTYRAPPLPGAAPAVPAPEAVGTPSLAVKPLAQPSGQIRLPLARPVASGASAGVTPLQHKRRRRHLLGVGRLWHWLRHGRGRNNTETAANQ